MTAADSFSALWRTENHPSYNKSNIKILSLKKKIDTNKNEKYMFIYNIPSKFSG